MTEEVPQVPCADKGGEGNDYERKHIIDRPLRVKSCAKCWSPLIIKSNKMYCEECGRFKNARTIRWINVRTQIEYMTALELAAMKEAL